MKKVHIDLKNCYGIKELKYKFNFTDENGYLIYAPNGTMKTSFAKCLMKVSKGEEPCDEIYSDRQTAYDLVDESNQQIRDNILVVESYNEQLSTEKVSTLLVNNELKKNYDSIHNELNKQREQILNELVVFYGKKNIIEIENEINLVFNKSKNIFDNLEKIIGDNILDVEERFNDIKYIEIFNPKTLTIVEREDFQKAISGYMKKYNDLMNKSDIFKKGIFNHNNAGNIHKSLQDNKFFEANHSVIMNGQNITSEKELITLLDNEKKKILTDKSLLTKFENIDKILMKNNEIKVLRNILETHNEIIAELRNIAEFKKKVWLSYLHTIEDSVKNLVKSYINKKDELKKIIEKAKKEKTDWANVIDIFNTRFDVPFIVNIDNQEEVILKENTAVISFKYNDGQELKKIEKRQLLNVLSTGEKRALYILNVIFEIQSRIKEGKETLLIIDDIADSFDYKNKYAIVEYLKDTLQDNIFKVIILTHNFDFYRTVGSRLDISRGHCLMTAKTKSNISLIQGNYLKDIFNVWKSRISSDDKILIASIPFVRNIVEYIEEKSSNNYLVLTGLLHIKEDSSKTTIEDLERIYNEVWRVPKNFKDKERIVMKVIEEQAELICKSANEEMELANKIVLSIAIRLEAERYMISMISDKTLISSIKKNQTTELFKIYKQKVPSENDMIKTIEQVNLMTPENIHMNSFMYEPLLDMNDGHLRQLFEKLKRENYLLVCKQDEKLG